MARRRILVIEDDPPIRRGLIDALEHAGYATASAANGDEGLSSALKIDCDLVLLDLTLPGRDGLEILKLARRDRPRLPFIILTARGGEKQRVEGLKFGADDYVVKPFSIDELMARVEAVLRRSAERPSDLAGFAIPGGEVDLARRQARFDDGEHCELSDREIELLRYLAGNPGRAIARDEILSHVWRLNPRAIVETRTIDMHITRLRGKLRDDPHAPRIILTVRGKGYMIGLPGAGAATETPQP
jgi:DNA-binding response OmpR family regulator